MAYWQYTDIKILDGITPEETIEKTHRLLERLGIGHVTACYKVGYPWIRLDGYGFISDADTSFDVIRQLSESLCTEVIMTAAQTTASCGSFGHFTNGAVTRYITGTPEGPYLAQSGNPEAWESEVFASLDSEEPYFSDHEIKQAAKHFGLPGYDNPNANVYPETYWDIIQ